MMYHFFLPFLFTLAVQGLTTDSLSHKASHQPAQGTPDQESRPQFSAWSNQEKKKKNIAANHDF